MAKDLYDALGVSRDATPDKIKQAYRRLARSLHPDVNDAPDAQARFTEVQEAYDTLSDPDKRRLYDRTGSASGAGAPHFNWSNVAGSSGGTPFDLDDDSVGSVFEAFFGGGQGGPGRAASPFGRAGGGARTRQEPTRQQQITVSFLTMVAGGTEAMSLERGGKPVRIEVRIPPGVKDGQKLRVSVPGGGSTVLIRVSVGGHPVFRRVGGRERDLEFDLPLSYAEAALGARVKVPTPIGPVDLSVPPGVASGRRLRLKGRGIAGVDGAEAGDLLAVIQITPPGPDRLSEAQRDAIRSLPDEGAELRAGDGWPG
ncbi:MAG: DnaJ C-terminal domain-containing protein [Planctomycetota bacterium]